MQFQQLIAFFSKFSWNVLYITYNFSTSSSDHGKDKAKLIPVKYIYLVYNTKNAYKLDEEAQIANVVKLHIHPNFTHSFHGHDLSILHIKEKIIFQNETKTIKLPQTPFKKADFYIFAGFGKLYKVCIKFVCN